MWKYQPKVFYSGETRFLAGLDWEAWYQEIQGLQQLQSDRVLEKEKKPLHALKPKTRERGEHASLDLHGLTAQQAFEAFCSFVEHAHNSGWRDVQVITGCGRSEDPYTSGGILRNEFPRWIDHPYLTRFIRKIQPATPKQGGKGALHVFLKKTSKYSK